MIFNTNKIVECNNKDKSLSYYMYTSERKYSDLSTQLHNNFCKSNKNTTTLLNNSNRNENNNFSNKIHKSFSQKKTSKDSKFRKSSPNKFRNSSPKRSFRKNNG